MKLSLFEETINAFKKCLSLDDKALEIWVALVDVNYFIGHYSDAIKYLHEAQNYFPNTAEIEYRLFGLYMQTDLLKDSYKHLKKGLQIDYEFSHIMKGFYPGFFKRKDVQEIMHAFKK